MRVSGLKGTTEKTLSTTVLKIESDQSLWNNISP